MDDPEKIVGNVKLLLIFYICCDLDMIFTKIESARAVVGPENS